jgi:exopolysaccharide production protein ExoY
LANLPSALVAEEVLSKRTASQIAWLRLADRSLAAVLFLLLLPWLVLIGIVLALLSKRSPLVAHQRVGRHGEPFWMIKFRTMWTKDAPSSGEFQWIELVTSHDAGDVKPRHDPRVTSRFASLCRTYSIDELPQLAHAATGRMSLVGPRPLTASELRKYYSDCSDEVLSIAPGMTGLWQVRGRNNLTYRQRARFDRFLVRHYSWALYGRILLSTIPRVANGNGAW